MRLLFVGGTGPVGVAACRAAIERGHSVIVAHTGAHELPNDIAAEHIHGPREDLLARHGPVEKARADVLVDTRATATNAAELLHGARAAGTSRLVVISSTDVYEAFVTGSGYDVDAKSWNGVVGRTVLPSHTLPIGEDATMRREPYPWATPGHDNAAMERALLAAQQDESIAVLRPGMIYGPFSAGREWTIVRLIRAGIHRIALPLGGAQFFARVAVERVGRAVVAAAERNTEPFLPVNVVDPYGWTYAGLVREIGQLLDWEWDPVFVEWGEAWHPFQAHMPYLCSDLRLRDLLGVHEPDPRAALAETVHWLMAHGPEHYPALDEVEVATARGPEKKTS